jgi:membrane protease YdiL (CAAX protease family)
MASDGRTSARPRDLVAVVVALVLPSGITWLYFFEAERFSPAAQLAIFNVVKVIQFAFPLVWVLAVQKDPVTIRPPHYHGVNAGLTFGSIIGAAMFALYLFVLRGSDVLVAANEQILAKVLGMGIDTVWKYAALGVFYSLFHSLLEEYYWRWFVFGQLRRFMSLGPAIAVSSLGFMAHHVLVLGKFFGFDSPAAWFFSGCIAVGGAFWAWLFQRTGSLLGPWLSHALVDAAIFLIGFDLVKGILLSFAP